MQKILPAATPVAACVQYTKRKKSWILATVLKYDEETRTYVVKDQFPEKRKKIIYDLVYPHYVTIFPGHPSEVFLPNSKVLALWMLSEDGDEWSSMFYKASVSPDVLPNDTMTIPVVFQNDNEVYFIDKTKIVKKPEKPAEFLKRSPNPNDDLNPAKRQKIQDGGAFLSYSSQMQENFGNNSMAQNPKMIEQQKFNEAKAKYILSLKDYFQDETTFVHSPTFVATVGLDHINFNSKCSVLEKKKRNMLKINRTQHIDHLIY